MTASAEDGALHLQLADGVEAHLKLPHDAVTAAPPQGSLRAAPGLTWVAQRGWQLGGGEGGRLQLACVQGPTTLWLPGMHHTLLDGASALARQGLQASTLQAGAPTRRADGYLQAFEAGRDGTPIAGRHLLGFGGGPEAPLLLCSASCEVASACAETLASLRLSGTSASQPSDTVVAHTVSSLASHPQLAAASFATLLLLGCGWLLARRPRPARRGSIWALRRF